MSSIYADAINAVLGATQPVTTGRVHHPACKSQAKRLETQREEAPAAKRQPAAIIHSENYRDSIIVVREYPGVASISNPLPGRCAYWSVFFTDEELALEASGEASIELRTDICRRAVDRMILNEPVWTGNWWERPLP